MKNKKKIDYRWIVAGFLMLVLVVLGVVVIFRETGKTIEVCTECSGADVCGPCAKKERVEIIQGSENDKQCSGGGEPVWEDVGGFVGLRFRGCKK